MTDPNVLAARLRAVAAVLERDGQTAWQRFTDWEDPGRVPAPGARGGGVAGGATDRQLEDRVGDRKASRYATEVRGLCARLVTDLGRLESLVGVATPARPDRLKDAELQSAQVAADGWCVSCWRVEVLSPVAVGRYRDLCRPCGAWRGSEGRLPPVEVVRLRFEGRLTPAAVAKAMAKG